MQSVWFIAFFTGLSLASSLSLAINSCKKEERTALLQFKNYFSMNKSSCVGKYPLLKLWDEYSQDCCSWFGVNCDNTTGHIIELNLHGSCLYGTIPSNNSLFDLAHLQELDLSGNNFNISSISHLLGNPGDFGFKQLKKLDLSYNNLRGSIPDTLFHFANLEHLDLSGNHISGDLSSIGQVKSLQTLDLSDCHVSGAIPESLGNLAQLTYLDLRNNKLKGSIPISLLNITNLEVLDLSRNALSGKLSHMFPSLLNNIFHLDFSENKLSDTVDLSMFKHLRKLEFMSLSSSGLSVTVSNSSIFSTLPVIDYLDLSSCDITINNLTYTNARDTFTYLDLSNNDIGEKLHPSICNLTDLGYLDLSDNQFSGEIPTCFGKFTTSLMVLYLHNNNFDGSVPQNIGFAKYLQYLDLSNNEFEGVLTKALTNCTNLEVLNLGGNMLMDSFPFWLGNLSSLKVLVLRENKFKGTIEGPLTRGFANLHIIDLSHNDLTGKLPSEYFESWHAMSKVENDAPKHGYMEIADRFYSVVIMNKGLSMRYEKILTTMKVIDFSHNMFYGDIPQSIGKLSDIQVLNLSGNSLEGIIPLSLENLSNLESLDLSSNKLSGEIPRILANLKFLAFFNVSQNNLSGAIPKGGQLDTFLNDSYLENPCLCGFPLLKLCESASSPKFPLQKRHRYKFGIDGFSWEIVLIGYICGILPGMILGSCIYQRKEDWFLRTFCS